MDPTLIVNLGLTLLSQVLAFITSIKGQSGLTDDQILAQAQTVTAGNDAAYTQLKAALVAAGAVAPTS
jgi:hypothetical protein